MEAENEQMVNSRLNHLGYRPLTVITPPSSTSHKNKPAHPSNKQRLDVWAPRVGLKDQALFYRQFSSLIRAGITLYQALDNLAPRLGSLKLREITHQMSQTAQEGGSISEVMQEYPSIFPPHVVGAVRAGELGGFLDIVLDEIATDIEQEIALRRGLWLPKSLFVQGFIGLFIIQPVFPYLWPKDNFSLFLKMVLFRNIPLLVLSFLVYHLIVRIWMSPGNAWRKDVWTLKIPVVGNLVRQKSLASFIRMLRRLYHAGLPPHTAWGGATAVAANSQIRKKLSEAEQLIKNNVPIHEAFAQTQLFSTEAEQLLATGVQSGEVIEMLDRIAEYYQENVNQAFGQARFWMMRLGINGFLITGGAALIYLVYYYFYFTMHFTDNWVK